MADVRLYAPDFESVQLIRCSPPSWMVRLALEEKGVPYDLEELDFEAREHRRPDLLAINPRGTIPVLVHDDLVLTEALSMLQYVDGLSSATPLMPSGRAGALALDRLQATSQLKGVGMDLFGYLMRTNPEQRDPIRVDATIGQLQAELEHWEAIYSPGWAMGDDLTLVDLSVMSYVATAAQLGLVLGERFPNLARALARWKQREAVKQTWPAGWTNPFNVLSG